ncbi:MFS transporter, DHA2 family, multidrug resistance protein [Streptomyces zhaozhouensis]|uniref:MFS transporter, DHA2 family, multidrug resistance protein n=1 Tax=Streptomyces zhaozhouensis TaxID=1300267 RepID=A0A286DXF0_9ACTN|nr:MFS transporter [Streptomyces zhaozhouensis]SOD63339.1 MFS transporter, DHA2 family, multidrug resistance protein [Streptomyces zhaozhouensis]
MTVEETGGRAGTREWVGLGVLALPTLLLALDISVLHLAAPHLSADLGTSSSELLWVLDIYGFMIAGFLVTMGTLGDRIGRRKLLMIGATAFGAASVAAAYASSPLMLIVVRALLGVAGATLMPSTLALISNMFKDVRQRSMAIGVWIICFSAGAAVGPVLGGVMLEHFWWGSVFLLGVPVMVVLLITAPLLLPEYRDDSPGRLDPVSVGQSLAAMIPLVYGIKELAKEGLSTLPLASLVFGALMGLLFVRRQRSLPAPLMDIRLFANRSFTAALTLLLVATFTSGGVLLFFIQGLQMVQGMSTLRAGLWMLPMTAGMIVGSVLAPTLARRVPPGHVVAGGFVLAAGGYALMSVDAGSLAWSVAGLLIGTLGLSPAMVLGTDLVLGSAPPERAGSASSLSETATELGMALGIAVLGSVGATVYRTRMEGESPEQLPDGAAEFAEDSLPGAVAVAEELPGDAGQGLLDTARDAFSSGAGVTTMVSGALMLVCAWLALRGLRHVRPIGSEKAPADAPADERPAGEGTLTTAS